MYAITGITGRVGGQIASELLHAGCQVRAVLRDVSKAARWNTQGCDIALAAMNDADALTTAFVGAETVFVLLPPIFDPTPGFTETRQNVAALLTALKASAPSRVVRISTIGAQAQQQNLLTQLQMMEQAFAELATPIAFIRPAWFVENVESDIESAKSTGVMPTFLQPLERPVAMVATADVAHLAAQLLREKWQGHRIVELEGPERVSPAMLATTLGLVLKREVIAQPVARATWDALFRSQGMRNPGPRIAMVDGFNEGWLDFEGGRAEWRRGTTPLKTALEGLVGKV
jgi:NAD(P)H dehydrogenase (quinone)